MSRASIRPLKPATADLKRDLTLARATTIYVCEACHGQSPKWQGQCPHCGEWNSLSAQVQAAGSRAAAKGRTALVTSSGLSPLSVAIAAGAGGDSGRLAVGLGELDRVLGGGLVPGSVTLLGGEPGIGKSTLLLQVAQALAAHAMVL